ncbi:unnamed protein product, partial [Ascophyllum nodosum]
MYRLRESIAEGISDHSTLTELSEPMTFEALLAKDPHDGQNLLAYAASCGRADWFIHLTKRIAKKCGVCALVKELRELDVNGAPLLFLAASSRTTSTCFIEVFQTLRAFLGMAGLLEQIEADDHRGRNIMMYAARGKHADTFTRVRDLYKDAHIANAVEGVNSDVQSNHARTDDNSDGTSVQQANRRAPARSEPDDCNIHASSKSRKWCDRVQKVDHRGKTILHHAAGSASLAVFALVFEMAREDGIGAHDRMALPDMSKQTPITLFLRNKYGSCDSCESDTNDKMYRLRLHAPKEGWMQQRMVPPVWKLTGTDQAGGSGKEFITLAKTELFHAVRGGPTMLDLTLEYIKNQKMITGNSNEVHLDKVLGMAICATTTPRGESQQEEVLREIVRHWGYGMLLAAAVRGGHEKVIKRVISAIEDAEMVTASSQVGRFLDETETWGGKGDSGAVVSAINAIKDSGRSLFALAIMSGKPSAAKFVYRNILLRYFSDQPDEVWNLLRGPGGENSPLTFAASASMTAEGNGVEMLHMVYHYRLGRDRGDDEMLELLRFRSAVQRAGRWSDSRSDMFSAKAVTPLGAAALRSNWVLFRLLYDMYETLRKGRWSREEVLNQLPAKVPRSFSIEKNQEMHEFRDDMDASLRSGAEGLSAVMWHDIVQAYQRATPEEPGGVIEDLPSWRGHFRDYSRRAVEVAIETMFFDDLRELVKEGFPLHDEQIPCLLENIEDHEQDVIDIVMYAVGNASNPLVMAAGVSKNVKTAEAERPMHRIGLRRLQKVVDEVTNELLDKLPHTVRGMGLTLLRPIVPEGRLSQIQQRRRDVLANLVGFIAVEWMLEPQLLVGKATGRRNYDGPNYVDPLQRAIDRDSEALQFVNKPLVLDYLHVKFNCGLPHWFSSKPDLASINEGFYTFYDFDRYELSTLSEKRPNAPEDKSVSPEAWDTFLLRFLQGWNPGRDVTTFGVQHNLEREKSGARLKKGDVSNEKEEKQLPAWNDFPRCTILPGLQFLLAGIIGKPETFYEVPAILFTFELFSYLIMLALFCSSVVLEESDYISRKEWAFYVFGAGIVWRETLEFLDGMPARQFRKGRNERRGASPSTRSTFGRRIKHSGSGKPGGKDLNRMVSGLARYILHDTWNLLDVLSIAFVLVAFIFRLRGLTRFGGPSKPGDDFFIAQFFLASSAPLLFARLLLLSQIDGTLGPMIQILWRLMSHTVRFSAFIVVVLTSYALAFHAIFATCDEGSGLDEKFGTFAAALLSVFSAGLGEFGDILDDFAGAEEYCAENPAPRLLEPAGVVLLLGYLVVMAVVLLNLLIAVLSSAHQKISSKGEMEFHLARTRLILQNSLAVAHRRIPAPFNLILVGIGFLFDGVQDFPAFCFLARRTEVLEQEASQASQISDSQRRANLAQGSAPPHKKIVQSGERTKFTPATSTYGWFTFEGLLQRGAFTLTMGVAALALSALLWIISLPWVAWSLLRWFRRWDQPRVRRCFFGDEGEEVSTNERQGHFRKFFFTLFGACAWILALVFAAVMCALCCIGSIILWGRGLWSVAEWTCWRFTEEGRAVSGEAESSCPTAMPGQERGDHWRHAWRVVQTRNYRIRQESGSVHFHVAPLLKSTTGLDMERLVMLVKKRDTKINGDRELINMDKEAAEALFSSE